MAIDIDWKNIGIMVGGGAVVAAISYVIGGAVGRKKAVLPTDDLTNHFLRESGRDKYGVSPAMQLRDGTVLSVQAGEKYRARIDLRTPPGARGEDDLLYESVEVGFPSRDIPELDPYKDPYGGRIYPYVPTEVLNRVISNVGGIKGKAVERQRPRRLYLKDTER